MPSPALLGRIGDTPTAVAAHGHLAFVGASADLMVLDVADPAHPVVLGRSAPLPGYIECLAVQGDMVWAGLGRGGVAGIDVSDPATPAVIATLPVDNEVPGIAVDGRYLYLAADARGLVVADIAEAARPRVVGLAAGLDPARAIAVSGHWAYVGGRKLHTVFDLTDPAHPRTAEVFGAKGQAGGAARMAIDGDLLAVTVVGHGMSLFDISRRDKPRPCSTCPDKEVAAVALGHGLAVVSTWAKGVRIFDISAPEEPVEVGAFATTHDAAVNDIAFIGPYVLLADEARGLWTVDVAVPQRPRRASLVPMWGDVADVAAYGRLAVALAVGTGVHVVDTANPAHLVEVGSLAWQAGDGTVRVEGAYGYVVDETGGLRIIDLADPRQPRVLAQCNLPDLATRLAVAGQRVFVPSRAGRLRVYDVADPARPRELPSPLKEPCSDAAVAGNLLCATGPTGLKVLDLTNDPATLIGHLPAATQPPWRPTLVAVEGRYAYLLAGAGQPMRVVSLADPAHPNVVATVPTGQQHHRLQVTRGRLFDCAGIGGVLTFDLTDPAHPRQLAHLQTPW